MKNNLTKQNVTWSVANENQRAVTLIEVFYASGLCASKAEARRLILGGGAYINDVKQMKDRELNTDDILHGEYVILRKGKGEYFFYHLIQNNSEKSL